MYVCSIYWGDWVMIVEAPVSNFIQSSETSDLFFQERVGCRFERFIYFTSGKVSFLAFQ